MSDTTRRFEIVIVGAGIAGLAAAIALHAPHRQITLLEQSHLTRETGANISLQPNAVKIAKRLLNLSPYLFTPTSLGRGTADKEFVVYTSHNQLHLRIPLATQDYGEDRMCFHRVDLHNALRQAALDRGAVIRTAAKVIGVDVEEGRVELETGEVVSGDLVVGADGIRSRVRRCVVGYEVEAVASGLSAFRTLIPTSDLGGIEGLPSEVVLGSSQTVIVVGRETRLIMGPSRSGTILGIVGLVADTNLGTSATSAGKWNYETTTQEFMSHFETFPTWTKQLLTHTISPTIWQLRTIPPLPTWHRGRTILIGDAAHAMLPTQGQGASQTFEDIDALHHFLLPITPDTGKQALEQALANVVAARKERAELIQEYSRRHAKMGESAESAEGGEGGGLNPKQFMDFNCAYEGCEWWLQRKAAEKDAVGVSL